MATAATSTTIGPRDAGRKMTLDEFTASDSPEGFLCELARGIVIELKMPGVNHGMTVMRVADLFILDKHHHQGRYNYISGGAECRISLPGMQSHRRPDQAVYLLPNPKGPRLWARWIPQIVVEIVNQDSHHRDYVEKRGEYLQAGVLEYWIFDPHRRKLLVLSRAADTWIEQELSDDAVYRTHLLPGLEVAVGEILGPPAEEEDMDDDTTA